jgi:four helix bundle protein
VSGGVTRAQSELPVIQKAFDLAREMTQRTRKLPRDLKFVLGDRILETSYDVLDILIEARYARDRRHLLVRANLLLERLRYQVRLCMEERLISVRQYEHVARLTDEVGRMVGGWAKACRA